MAQPAHDVVGAFAQALQHRYLSSASSPNLRAFEVTSAAFLDALFASCGDDLGRLRDTLQCVLLAQTLPPALAAQVKTWQANELQLDYASLKRRVVAAMADAPTPVRKRRRAATDAWTLDDSARRPRRFRDSDCAICSTCMHPTYACPKLDPQIHALETYGCSYCSTYCHTLERCAILRADLGAGSVRAGAIIPAWLLCGYCRLFEVLDCHDAAYCSRLAHDRRSGAVHGSYKARPTGELVPSPPAAAPQAITPVRASAPRKAVQQAARPRLPRATLGCLYCTSTKHTTRNCGDLRRDVRYDRVRSSFELPPDLACAYCKARGDVKLHRTMRCRQLELDLQHGDVRLAFESLRPTSSGPPRATAAEFEAALEKLRRARKAAA
ncbi:hypothetical protein SPRG_04867 [Saprolegnia parasitica CBS 223.65]|uniref:Uncharacterized protein n=1 Tax=Saprolegnia parasitica (strain CBS 223.65) TaxID=695850 RepID=A0A067CKP2_SAPPC|nr:hypothetical protein SPRG_04867 [Saprolegnia parasitica CBS 223.65]KDO29750.1 hypothetical protein SPRG_04867 [Saprolegnia parasitica CBS 223.65]|eukprot:XP_012199398.1 hypothetical protein SPRG_04867 [Saprolegnia parasitica CBS 223.65]